MTPKGKHLNNSTPNKMAKKAKTVKDLNLEIEMLSEKFKKFEEREREKDIKIQCLENTLKNLNDKIKNVEELLQVTQSKSIKEGKQSNCKECGKIFSCKTDLTRHIKITHPKEFKCKICEKTFCDSWKLELHSKLHTEILPFKCHVCQKLFFVEWRLRKHVLGHDKERKCCHFFNNGKVCPYEEIGCKFKHEESNECRYGQNCYIKLCQFKHSSFKKSCEGVTDKEIEIIEIEKSDEYKKYDSMDENDQFDVYQEICLNICWGGIHKCMKYDEDNELLGVSVEKIRDDYNNRREEKFHCEKCEFFSTKMEDVKEHFMTKHKKSYSCWECDKKFKTMFEFKRHYGSIHYVAE